jgi:ribosome maturation factor RimP
MGQRQRREAPQSATPSSVLSGPILDSVRATCEQIVGRRDLELVELTLGRSGRGHVLSITVDDPEGPTSLEEIERISEEISRALDAEDPFPGRYMLEVASAGLERPLVRPRDYVRFEGRKIKVRTHEPVEGRKVFTGTIRSAGDETFVLDGDEDSGSVVVEIPYVSVSRASLVVDWVEELRGRPAGPAAIGAAGASASSEPGGGQR